MFLKAEGGAKRIRIRINNSEVVATDPFLESLFERVETERVHGQAFISRSRVVCARFVCGKTTRKNSVDSQ